MTVYRIIRTTHIYPPIPVRSFDWCATFSDYHEGPTHHPDPFKRLVGWGATESGAIAALHDALESALSDQALHEFLDDAPWSPEALARFEAIRA